MKRSTQVLMALLVVLAALAVWVTQRPGEQSLVTAAGDRLVEIDSASIDAIEVRSVSSAVRLERRGMEWSIVSPVQGRASVAAVGAALGQAGTLRVKSIATSKREKHPLFQVDSASGTTVRLSSGGTVQAAFVVGKPSEGFADTYVRKEASDEVALIGGSFAWTFNRALRDWRDRTILSLVRSEVREVGFQYGDTVFTLTLADSLWRIDGRATNAAAVDGLLGALTTFQCDDFLDAAPSGRISAVVSVGGQQLQFTKEPGGTRWWVRSSASSDWYVVEGWRADQVLKRRKDLLSPAER
jgi:hypothetical protein